MKRGVTSVEPLLERDEELAALRSFVAAGGAGGARPALIEGAGGIGKSALMAAAGAAAEGDWIWVLAARGSGLAHTLFVTPKTVEVHLSNADRKLEIKGRRELAGALAPA